MKSEAVLMSAYNGEKYIREQIDSVLNQQGVEVVLFVRDDGSCDSTKDILSGYEEKGLATVCYGENLGVGNSFMQLVYTSPAEYDYYAFADQDDIWAPDKLMQAVKLLEDSGEAMYASNQECVDSQGNSLGLRYEEGKHIHLLPEEIIGRNMLAGCTMVFTSQLRDILAAESSRPSNELLRNRIHDVWVAAAASLHGGIIYDSRSFISYRQHGGNVVGAYEGGFIKKLRQRLKKLGNRQFRKGRSLLAKELISSFPESAANFPLVGVYAGGKVGVLKHRKLFCSYTGESGIGFTAKVLLGLF